MRPKRLYVTDKNKYFYLVNGKRKYIKVPDGLSQKQVVKINIGNFPKQGKRLKRRKKRKIVKFTSDISDGKYLVRSFKPSTSSLPSTFYVRDKSLDIKELSSDELKKISGLLKNIDTNDKILDEKIKNLIENKINIPLPEPEKLTKFISLEEARDIATKRVLESGKQRGRKLLEDIPPSLSKSFSAPVKTDLLKKIERIQTKVTEIREKQKSGSTLSRSSSIPESTAAVLDDIMFPPETKEKEYSAKDIPSEMKGKTNLNLFKDAVKYLLESDEPISVSNYSSKKGKQELINKIIDVKPDFEFDSRFFKDNETFRDEIIKLYGARKSLGTGSNNNNGLWNDEIETILKSKIKDVVPVISSDEVDKLLPYVNNSTKRFGFVMNTSDSSSDGTGKNGNDLGHWVSVYINNEDDFPSVEYFDPLANKPNNSVINSLKQIAKKINPEYYFKFKINNLKVQPDNNPDCGYYSIKYLDDRFNGVPFDIATGYTDFIDKVGGDFSKEKLKEIQKYKSYL